MSNLEWNTDQATNVGPVELLEAMGVFSEDLTDATRAALHAAFDLQAETAWRAGWNACVRDAGQHGGSALPLGAARARRDA